MSSVTVHYVPRILTPGVTPGIDQVDSPSKQWADMMDHWRLIEDLMGGTLSMREAGTLWLPLEPKEQVKQYNRRLSRAILFNGLRDAINKITSKPFTKETTTKGKLPVQLENMPFDIDRKGSTITSFAKKLTFDAAKYGLSHFYVDFPSTSGKQTLGDETFGNVRPYFTHVSAVQVIGHKSVMSDSGERLLTQVRVKETFEEAVGEFAVEEVSRIRVFEPGLVRTYEKRSKDRNYIPVGEREITIGGKRANFIPFVTVYFNETGFMTARPPYEDLAWLNLAHWQSNADHRNYLRFVRIGTMFGKGFSPAEIDKGIVISPNGLVTSTNENASLEYVEHKGTAYDAGKDDLAHLEQLMETLGTQPLLEGSAKSSATGKMIDENERSSQGQSWIRNVENALEEGFLIAHKYVKADVDPEFAVDVYNDFNISMTGRDDVSTLLEMRDPTNPQISHETLISELIRRAVLSDDVNAGVELERIAKETLVLAGGGGDNNPDDTIVDDEVETDAVVGE